jgi:hypothetical protein
MSARETIKATYIELMTKAIFSFENKRALVEYAVNQVLGLDVKIDESFTMKQLSEINDFVATL